MSDQKYEPVFIPCGDSFEKMNEISDELLEEVSGGCSSQQTEAEGKSLCINLIVIEDGCREN